MLTNTGKLGSRMHISSMGNCLAVLVKTVAYVVAMFMQGTEKASPTNELAKRGFSDARTSIREARGRLSLGAKQEDLRDRTKLD